MTGMVIAVLLLLLFAVDLSLGIPFRKVSMAMDITMLVAAVLLGFASFQTLREQI